MQYTSFGIHWHENGSDRVRRRGHRVSATALGTVLIGLAAAPGAALADCNQQGTPNPDIIVCDDTLTTGIVDLDGAGDNDTIDVNSGTLFRVKGGGGVDTIRINGGTVTGAAVVNQSSINVAGGDGGDIIELRGGQIGSPDYNSTVSGENDDDHILLDGTTVYGIVRADTAVRGTNYSNTAVLRSGRILLPTNNTTTGYIGGFGVDDITVGSGSADVIMEIQGGVNGETGDDTILLKAGATMFWVDGRQGVDSITLDGATVQNFLVGGLQSDTILLKSGIVGGNVSGDLGGSDEGNDTITLDGATVVGGIEGNGGNDTMQLWSGQSGSVFGNAGNDIIEIGKSGNASSGGPQVGSVSGNEDNDQISWYSGSLTSINGGLGSDLVTVIAAGYDGSQLLDGGDDALVADTYIDELSINGKTITTTGTKLLNWEKLTLAGGGLTLSDGAIAVGDPADATTGLFLTGGAYLKASAPLSLTGNLSIGSGSVYEQLVSGTHAVTGRLANAGTINLQNGTAADVLSVGGNYTGGGQLLVEIDGDTADRMAIAGDVLGAPTQIVTNFLGENTTGVPIEVVHVDGATREGDFTAADFDLGAYSYALQLDGGTWQFAPTEMTDSGTLYPTLGKLLDQFGRQTIATHFERTGSWVRARATGEDAVAASGVTTLAGGDPNANGNVWIRAIGQWADGDGQLKGGPASIGNQKLSYEADTAGVQGGVDAAVAETSSYLVTAGLFGQTGRLTGNAKNETNHSAAGSSEADAWGLGGSIGLDAGRFYVEAVGAWNSYDISTESRTGSADTNGNGYYVSFEAGREFAVSKSVKLVPQAQFAWVSTDTDSFTDASGTKVSFEDQTTPIGRLGLALDAAAGTYNDMPLRLTGILNYWQDFGDDAQTSVGGTPLEIDQTGGAIEAGGGFHWGTEQTPLHLHGELTYSTAVGGDGEQSWNGTVGMRIAF
ncbi:autotransporter outer membrane beta-barrel domain-containing protein [Aestuariivirga sp.]|uniref:autotransporter outer membrane beta-barrel domain-containing protein n=1 Tax=Aestuariivirga sp. TaxID=2650926 RepID=UPI003BAC06B4